MQFTKTLKRAAGKRAPNTIEVDLEKLVDKGTCAFIDANTMLVEFDDGTKAVLFISQSYSYTEVKPVEDALSAKLGVPAAASRDDANDGDGEPVPASAGANDGDEEPVPATAGAFDSPLGGITP